MDTHDASVVDQVVDAFIAENLGGLACRVLDRLDIVHIKTEHTQSLARRRDQGLQGTRFGGSTAGGEYGVVGRLEELRRHLQADSAVGPISS